MVLAPGSERAELYNCIRNAEVLEKREGVFLKRRLLGSGNTSFVYGFRGWNSLEVS